MKSSTEVLRELLDERGVEWTKPKRIWWELIDCEPDDSVTIVEGVTIEAATDGTLVVYPLTPEQAIAATLGAGTCHDLGGTGANDEQVFNCSECGCVLSLYDRDGSNNLCTSFVYDYPRYCPECGRRIEVDDG